jgi:light-regulated signal transduction histidine kinase (bacteriophytochrome)
VNTDDKNSVKLQKAERKIRILEDMVESRTRNLYSANQNLKKRNESLREVILRNEELEQFAYVASHDLQEPLITIKSFIDLLGEEYGDKLGIVGKQYLDFISESSYGLSSVVKDLLDYSRLGTNLKMTKVDCNKLVESIQKDLTSAISKSKATFKVEKLPEITGFKTELRLLFQNLISNAIKFCAEDTPPHIIITAQKGKNWTFCIQDNGIGIAKENQKKIFTIFQRLHSKNNYEGTGIGLAQCKKIINLHGGEIWINSKQDLGSTFCFSIPFYENEK